jgi:hypothetical protein
MSDVVDLAAARQRKSEAEALRYLPGVNPFDPSNPAHIREWNTIHQLGWSEQRAHERARQEGATDD